MLPQLPQWSSADSKWTQAPAQAVSAGAHSLAQLPSEQT